jgi:glycerol-3-phosphate dehydrogenase
MHLAHLSKSWDLIIIGGGITGAGVFREASRMNLNVLLIEQRDFAWGTSSRSSKLIHGGLRYLREGQLQLTREAVQERERLLKEAPGLVEPLEFLVPVYKDRGPGKWMLEAGLSLYDLIASKRQHRFYPPEEFFRLAPHLDQKLLEGGFLFYDAQADDARLVLRLIQEGISYGGVALNYTRADKLLRNADGRVIGIRVEASDAGSRQDLRCKLVVNATGVWAEQLQPSPDPQRHLRPQRGSHLVYSPRALPFERAVSFMHPDDGRALFILPWDKVVVVGTTDLDHHQDLADEPQATESEVIYLVKGLARLLPSLDFSLQHCRSVWSGIRPVLSKGDVSPSKESRQHMVWEQSGLITVTGGKLTIFRKMARDVLTSMKPYFPETPLPDEKDPVLFPVPDIPATEVGMPEELWRLLCGRYGSKAHELVDEARQEDLVPIPDTRTLWAELSYAVRHEQVKHLDDLLLRRVRIGLQTPQGGKTHLKHIQKLCRPYLDWDRTRWRHEIRRYLKIWQSYYALPAGLTEYMPGRRAGAVSKIKRLVQTINRKTRSGVNLMSM